MSADIIDFADRRRARTLPPPRVEAGQPMPPIGKRPGDKVRCRLSGAIGTVLNWRVERLWRVDIAPTPRPTFMLGIRWANISQVVLAEEVDPVTAGAPERIDLPADIEA